MLDCLIRGGIVEGSGEVVDGDFLYRLTRRLLPFGYIECGAGSDGLGASGRCYMVIGIRFRWS
jgi:hypothetical protein